MNEKKAIDTYLNEIKQDRLLTDDEERLLAERIQQGDQKALNRLVTANLGYVVTLAHQHATSGVAAEDLISEGNIALMRAAARFDGSRGKRFVTFAAPYIREAMREEIEQQTALYRVPRDAGDSAAEKKRSRALSIDAPVGGSHNLSLGRMVPNPHASDPASIMEEQALASELAALVDRLEGREKMVATCLYGTCGAPLTMAETAAQMGLKRERVRQIRNKAIRQLCRMTTNRELRKFLSR